LYAAKDDKMFIDTSFSDIDLRKFQLYQISSPVYRDMVDVALKAAEQENTLHS
jgi:hypothetical protein